MLNETIVEQRLITLEQAVSDLQKQVARPPGNWLTQLIGSISDEAAFLEALEYGRAFRQADQPGNEDD
jgi:hypothetical protein